LFPQRADDDLYSEIHRVTCAVVDQGGAVGYDTPPSPDDTRRWLDDVLESVRTNTAVLAVAAVDGRVEAMGLTSAGVPTLCFAARARAAPARARGVAQAHQLYLWSLTPLASVFPGLFLNNGDRNGPQGGHKYPRSSRSGHGSPPP